MINRRELLERRYRLQFPDSFYAFWEFSRSHAPLLDVLGDNLMGMALTGSGLVGPFEFLNESKLVEENPLWDARYYNDPPGIPDDCTREDGWIALGVLYR